MTSNRLRSLLTYLEKPSGVDGCWLWTGSLNASGYSSHLAHRTFYELLIAEIPQGMQLDHLCRVRNCVNPHHMEVVTPQENKRRSRVVGPFQPVSYCRNGHALIGNNRRVWSDGRGGKRVYCYLCHDEMFTELRVRRTA